HHSLYHAAALAAIYTLSLHDALPISPTTSNWPPRAEADRPSPRPRIADRGGTDHGTLVLTTRSVPIRMDPHLHAEAVHCPLTRIDRKSTRLNSSHVKISYAVFCLKKK